MTDGWRQSDLDSTMGVVDGPLRFEERLGFATPTYIDPRYDLMKQGKAGTTRLDYHVPFRMRGMYKVYELPEGLRSTVRVNEDDFVLCDGKIKSGGACGKYAYNRSPFCAIHGGELHPADKKLTADGDIAPDVSKVRKLSRAQKVAMKIIPVSELEDAEIYGLCVYNEDGRRVSTRRLTDLIHAEFTAELMNRMENYAIGMLPNMLKTLADIATDEDIEPGDRIKAAIWMAEKVMGKAPQMVIHGKTDEPYEQIGTFLETTSRADFRRAIEAGSSAQPEHGTGIEVIDADFFEYGDNGSSTDLHRTAPGTDARTNGGVRSSDTPNRNGNGQGSSDPRLDLANQGPEHSNGNGKPEADSSTEEPRADETSAYDLMSRRERLQAQKEQRRRAKNRRFVARLFKGMESDNLPYLIEFKKARRINGDPQTYTACLIRPEDQTEEIVDRIARSELVERLKSPDEHPRED